MKKLILMLLSVFIFFNYSETLNAMIPAKEDVVAYKAWLKEGNKGTMLEFFKVGFQKGIKGDDAKKLAQAKTELENQLKIQESRLALLQKQFDDLLKGKGISSTDFATRAQDPKIKTLEKEIADLRAEVERLKKLKISVGEEEEKANPETIFWKGKAVDVVAELQARLEQVKQYGKEAEEALQKFRRAPFEEDQNVLFQYLKNLNQAIKDSRARSFELNDLRFDAKLSDAGVRVPKEYRSFSDKLEIELDKFTKIWRPQQFFGLLPWVATDVPMKNRIDEIRRTNLAWDRNQQHLAPAPLYEKIEPVSLEYKPGEAPSDKPASEEGQIPPPPPPPPPATDTSGVIPPPPPPPPAQEKPGTKGETKPQPDLLGDITKGTKLKSKEQRIKDALKKVNLEKYTDEVLKDNGIATEKEAVDKAKFLQKEEDKKKKN